MENEIILKWVFKKAPEKVWEFLTNPDLLAKWLMPTNFKPILGYKFQFQKNNPLDCTYGGMVSCEIMEILEPKLLSYSWDFDSEEGKPKYHSLVTWHLNPCSLGTELVLIHSGFIFEEHRIDHNAGWKELLEKLENQIHLEKNEPNQV